MNKDAQVQARIPRPMLDDIDALASKERRNRAQMVRLLIEEALDARTTPRED